jgi:hypothetical protein
MIMTNEKKKIVVATPTCETKKLSYEEMRLFHGGSEGGRGGGGGGWA